MVRIVRDYMNRMGITDTQYIIGRHYDKDHPHIAYNHIDNNGNTITDRNDRFRSEKSARNSQPNTVYILPPVKKTSNSTVYENPTKPNMKSITP